MRDGGWVAAEGCGAAPQRSQGRAKGTAAYVSSVL